MAQTLADLTDDAKLRSRDGVVHCSLAICSWQPRFSRASGLSSTSKQWRALGVLVGACQPLKLVHDLISEALALQGNPKVVRKDGIYRFKSWWASIFFDCDVDFIALKVQILLYSFLALQKSLQFRSS